MVAHAAAITDGHEQLTAQWEGRTPSRPLLTAAEATPVDVVAPTNSASSVAPILPTAAAASVTPATEPAVSASDAESSSLVSATLAPASETATPTPDDSTLSRRQRNKLRQQSEKGSMVISGLKKPERKEEAITDDNDEEDTEPSRGELNFPRSCYVCKKRFIRLHQYYDQLCPTCAKLNWQKRNQVCLCPLGCVSALSPLCPVAVCVSPAVCESPAPCIHIRPTGTSVGFSLDAYLEKLRVFLSDVRTCSWQI